MEEGWIKLHRKIWDNPIVRKDNSHFLVWVYLLLHATHKDYDVMFNNQRITLKQGQLIIGRRSISVELGVSESKIQRILKLFENEQQIEQQTTPQNRLITILNWNKYQCSEQPFEQQVNNNRTTGEQQVNTNKNIKNIKNVRNNINNNISAKANKKVAMPKHKYGEYQHVLLKDEELQKLKNDYQNWEELIKYLDEYIEMKGYKAKSHYLCIKKWVVKAVKEQSKMNAEEEFLNGKD